MSLHEKWFYEKPTLISAFYYKFGMSRNKEMNDCYKTISKFSFNL